MPFINKENQQGLREWKYKGSTASLTYKYLLSPFGDWLMRFVPTTVAPNTITLVAFAIIVVNHFVFAFVGGTDFNHPPPTWKVAVFLVALFLYQNLDNMDGKQARRTKTATPVGMLFDHGADALTTMFVTFQLYKMLHGASVQFFFFVCAGISMVPNFILLWNEYSTGAFTLDVINPIDEGLLMFQVVALVGCFVDFGFLSGIGWRYPIKYELMTVFLAVATLVAGKSVVIGIREAKKSLGHLLYQFLTPLILVAVLAMMHCTDFGQQVYAQHHYKFFYILTFYWCRNEIYLMTCSVTGEKCTPLNRGNLTFLVSMVAPLLYPPIMSHLNTYLVGVLGVHFILLVHFIVGFLNESAVILGIQLFSIKPKRE